MKVFIDHYAQRGFFVKSVSDKMSIKEINHKMTSLIKIQELQADAYSIKKMKDYGINLIPALEHLTLVLGQIRPNYATEAKTRIAVGKAEYEQL